MAGWWHKVQNAFGFGPEEDEAYGLEEHHEEAVATEPELPEPDLFSARATASTPRRGALVSLPGSKQPFKVLVVEPRSFDEVQTIVDQLKSRRPVILNLEGLDKELAQRILNFLGGAIYALAGESQKVSSSIFFFAPQGVDVGTLGRGYSGTAMGGGLVDEPDELEERFPGLAARPALSRDPLSDLLERHRQAEADKAKGPWDAWRK